MGDYYYVEFAFFQLLDQREYLRCLYDVECCGWFVEDNEFGVLYHCV